MSFKSASTRLAIRSIFLIVLLGLVFLENAYGQQVPSLRVQEWFYDRLIWAVVYGIICSLPFLWFIRHHIKYQAPAFNLDSKVRRAFRRYTILALIIGGFVLLLDAWLGYSFGTPYPLSAIFSQVWWGWETGGLLLFAELALYGTTALAMRSRRGFPSGRYALFPWGRPRLKSSQ